MIFIVVKFKVKPDWSERWLGLVEDFTQATRQEPGNLWFDWSRSVEDPNEFVLVEAFKDDAAGDHVNSAHFKQAMADMPQALAGDAPDHQPPVRRRGLGPDGRTHHLAYARVLANGITEHVGACGSAGLNSMSSSAMSTA